MKFYRYPLALIAYALLFVYGLSMMWHKLGGVATADFWLLFPIGASAFLLISFILSRLKLAWELDVLVQVICILAPVLWFINQRESFKSPEYIFIVEPDYKGTLEIHFNYEKDAPTNARSTQDTIYFKFDENGRMLINESGDYVKKMMKKNLFAFAHDHTRKHIPLSENRTQPPIPSVLFDSASVVKGKLMAYYYTVKQ